MSKPSESSLHLAAQCWCDPETSDRVMDEKLALAFARRYDAIEARVRELEDALHNCISLSLHEFRVKELESKLRAADEWAERKVRDAEVLQAKVEELESELWREKK